MISPKEFCTLAGRLMRQPAVAYHEHLVAREVLRICDENNLSWRSDRFGNIYVEIGASFPHRPMILAAHMDHPGFRVTNQLDSASFEAEFLGNVPAKCFKTGIPLRLIPGNEKAALGLPLEKEGFFRITVPSPPIEPPRYAVWELVDFNGADGLIHGRACDDLIGVASILAVLIQLQRSQSAAHVIGIISRAEEVGFQGALMAARHKSVQQDAFIISLETSKELPGSRMGHGVIIRVGDRASIFSSGGTRFLAEAGGDLKKARPDFHFQRCLMSGGTCEATAYQEYGYETAAVCVALGNYHNATPQFGIAAEFVSLADALSMVELLAFAAEQMPGYANLVGRLPARLDNLAREAEKELMANPLSIEVRQKERA